MGINYNLFYISIIFGKHTISNILLIIVLLNLNGLFSLDYPQTSFDALVHLGSSEVKNLNCVH